SGRNWSCRRSQDRHHRRRAAAAEILRQAERMPLDLPFTRFAADLHHHIAYLRDPGCAHRMALGFQSAAGIDGTRSVQRRAAIERVSSAVAFLYEAQVLAGDDLGD